MATTERAPVGDRRETFRLTIVDSSNFIDYLTPDIHPPVPESNFAPTLNLAGFAPLLGELYAHRSKDVDRINDKEGRKKLSVLQQTAASLQIRKEVEAFRQWRTQ